MKVIQDFLPERIFLDIEDAIRANVFLWALTETAYSQEDDLLAAKDWSFAYVADYEEIRANPFFSALAFMLKSMLLVNGEYVEKGISRIRFGLTFPLVLSENKISPPHIDDDEKHKNGILYLNTSDGDTIIYNELHVWGANDEQEFKDYVKGMVFTEKIRIKPERNKLLLFNGEHFHSSTKPTKTFRRLIINFNYL